MTAWTAIYKNKLMLTGGGLVLTLLIVSILAPWLSPFDPGQIDLNNVLAAPSMEHLFGTDQLGRDVLSRMIWGARISLKVGFVATGLAILVGTFLGALSGYYGGWIDSVIMRFVDIMLCFPTFFLILAVIALLEPSIWNIMIIIGLTGWMGEQGWSGRILFRCCGKGFCSSARAIGAGDAADYFFFIILFPTRWRSILVCATLGIAGRSSPNGPEFSGYRCAAAHPSWGKYSDGRQG